MQWCCQLSKVPTILRVVHHCPQERLELLTRLRDRPILNDFNFGGVDTNSVSTNEVSQHRDLFTNEQTFRKVDLEFLLLKAFKHTINRFHVILHTGRLSKDVTIIEVKVYEVLHRSKHTLYESIEGCWSSGQTLGCNTILVTRVVCTERG